MKAITRRARATVLPAMLIAFFMLSVSATSHAQVHWDASAQLGVNKRFLGGRPSGSSDAGFGPIAQLQAHLALLPLLRVGAYFGHDISPISGESARQITFGGLHLKGMLPWVRGSMRAWVFAGFGYAGVDAPSYSTTITVLDGSGTAAPKRVSVADSGGGFFDVPLGIGASYKLHGAWALCAELGARLELGASGSTYDGPSLSIPAGPVASATAAGVDQFALGLSVGVLLDL